MKLRVKYYIHDTWWRTATIDPKDPFHMLIVDIGDNITIRMNRKVFAEVKIDEHTV